MLRGACKRISATCNDTAMKIKSSWRIARFALMTVALVGLALVVGSSMDLASATQGWPSII
jgi:hypothetical protein